MPETRPIATLLAATLISAGCSPYAVIQRRDAAPLEARILESDPLRLTVESPDGQRLEVPRADIRDIDHPGNVAMAMGLPNTVVGSLFSVITVFMLPAAIQQGWPDTEEEQLRAAPVALAFGLFAAANLAIGLPPFLWGSETWFTSTGNAQPSEQPSVRIGLSAGGIRVTF